MIHINLLPVREIIQHNKAKQQLFTLFTCFGILLFVLAAVFFFQKSKITTNREKLAAIQQERQQYVAIERKIKKLEEETKTLERQIGVIDRLKKSSSLTVHALDELAKITPADRMWLTSLSQNGTSLSISGMALDNQTIAKFMDDLKSSEYIGNVNLENSALKAYAGKNLKSFSISCSLVADTQSEFEQNTQNNNSKG